jgi:2-dehydro-3-deoxygalactonokinase
MVTGGLVAVDWGTTNLRAYRIGPDGAILDRRDRPSGILRVEGGAFEPVLREAVRDWTAPGVPILLSGMIGSRQGWVEVPYAPCPAGPAEIAARIHRTSLDDGTELAFVPGLLGRGPDGTPDVMRGEETQLLGSGAEGLHCLPGTHSKWAVVEGGRVVSFRTHMTGEFYDLLVRHSILGRLMEPDAPGGTPEAEDAFDRGVERARASGGLLHHAFAARTLGLTGELSAAALPYYLSGVLIGHELGAALAEAPGAGPVTLAGSERLCALYARALASLGRPAATAARDAAALGLFRLWREAWT